MNRHQPRRFSGAQAVQIATALGDASYDNFEFESLRQLVVVLSHQVVEYQAENERLRARIDALMKKRGPRG